MFRPFAFLLALFPALLLPEIAAAQARIYEQPQVEYSAERKIQRGNRWQAMRVHYAPGKERLDLQGSAASGNSLILRQDLGLAYVIMPMLRAYGEAPPDVGAELDQILRSLSLTPDGRDTIEGQSVRRFRVDGRLKGRMWLTAQNVPVRIEGKSEIDGEWLDTLVEQRGIELKRQDPNLFEVPPGLSRIDLRDPRWSGIIRQIISGR